MRRWCAVLTLKGYTSPDDQESVIREFRKIVNAFEEVGVEGELDLLVWEENEAIPTETINPRRGVRREDQG
jgi:hypothetical protein